MGGSREGELVQPRHAYHSVPRHALSRPTALRAGAGHAAPRRASAEGARGRHSAAGSLVLGMVRRVLLVALVAIVAGDVVYVVLPVPSAAAPGLPATLPEPPAAAAALAPAPGLVAGVIDGDDLLTDPVGVNTAPADVGVDGPLIGWPVSDHTPSTGFGYRSDPFTHKQRWHDGVDLGQPCGDAVHASLDGTVAFTGWAGGYGNRIILRHADRGGHTFSTTYNHLSRIEVTVGQAVRQADVIARIGSTGRSTACHLHFEVILDGSYVDPMRFLTGDQSKASLSRRVGSYMPAGLPSPTATTVLPSPTATATRSKTPQPSPTPTPTPTPSSSGTPTPSPSGTPTPSPSTASPGPTPTPTPGSATPSPTGSPSASNTVTSSPATSGTATSAGSSATTPSASRSTTATAGSTP